MHNERYNISAVQKALKILSLFIRNDEGYTFTRVVNESGGMNKSNVLRILTTLRNEGFLCYDEHTSYYYLGRYSSISKVREPEISEYIWKKICAGLLRNRE